MHGNTTNIFHPDQSVCRFYLHTSGTRMLAEGECDGLPTYGFPGFTTSIASLPSPLPAAFKIEGTLLIVGTHVWIGKTVKMGNAAAIEINAGASLSLTGSTVIEGCETMWKGVSLGQFSTLNVGGNSEINDAVNAIFVSGNCTVNLFESLFKRNFRTLYALAPSGTANITFNLSTAGSVVDGAGPLKPPHAQQGFWDYGSKAESGFRFVRCNSVGGNLKVGEIGDPQCVFRNCAVGVSANGSHLVVENCRFEEMTGGLFSGFFSGGFGMYGEYGYYKVQQCEFFRCMSGISLYHMNFLVDDNEFSRVHQALFARQSVYQFAFPNLFLPTVSNNVVDGANYGFIFFLNENSNPVIRDNHLKRIGKDGISVNDLNMPLNTSYIHTNTIELAGGGGWPQAAINGSGVGIRLTQTRNAAVCRNTISHTADDDQNIGIIAHGCGIATVTNNSITQAAAGFGEHIGIDFKMTDLSSIDCNAFTDNANALVVAGVCTNTKISKNTFVSGHRIGMTFNNAVTQTHTHSGNRWTYTTNASMPGAVNNGSDVNLNEFTVDCAEDPAFCPFVVSAQGWFVPQSTPELTPLCNPGGNICSVPVPFTGDDDEAMLLQIIGGQLQFSDYAEPAEGLAALQALRWIASNNLSTTAPYAAYWTQKAGTPEGILAQWDADALAWKTAQATAEQERGALWADMMALLEGTDQSETAINTFETKRAQWETLQAARDAGFAQLLGNWTTANDALPEGKIFVKNHKQVNALLLDLHTRHPLALTEGELEMLEAIAEQCLYAGGPAVLQARYLLSLEGQSGWDDAALCGERSRSASSLGPVVLQVAPNPNDGTFRVLLPEGATAEGAQALLYDLTGRLLLRQNIRSANERFDVTGNVPPGLYLIEVRDAAGACIGLAKVSVQ